MTDPYDQYFNSYYIPPSLSPKQKKERLEEIVEEKLKGYKLHPVVEKKYRDHGYVLSNWVPSAQQEQEKTFWQTVELAGNPVKKEIHQVYRIRVLNKKEYFWYNEELKSTNKLGGPIHCHRIQGKFENPHFTPTFAFDTGQVSGSEIESVQTEYELEWPKHWTPELEQQLLPKTSFVVISNTARKYSGFDYDDFKKRTFDELIMLGKYGTLSPVMVKEIEKVTKKK